jgi:mono/diheme cytochrome c family protein
MPKFKLAPDEIQALVVFLKSRRGINFNETSLQRYRTRLEASAAPPPAALVPGAAPVPAPTPDLAAKGAALLNERACLACHKLGPTDGGIAPDLSYVGLTRQEGWILAHFKNPRALVPDSIMPAFRFPDQDFTALTAYLAGLKTPPPAMAPAEAYKELCSRCHGEKGDGNGPIALYLDPSPRDLTKAAFMNSKPLERFVSSVKNGVAGTSMPPWAQVLDDAQARGVVDYVFATFVKEKRREIKPRNLPDTNPVAFSDASAKRGEETFLRRCTGCHGRKADGKGPNSTDILPRPRNLRNAPFLEQVSDRRLLESVLYGVQGTAMPPWVDYGLTQNEAGDLVNYVRSLQPRR